MDDAVHYKNEVWRYIRDFEVSPHLFFLFVFKVTLVQLIDGI